MRTTTTSSLPVWGVWIEIQSTLPVPPLRHRRSPYGECGLKYHGEGAESSETGRSPYGECGLKWGFDRKADGAAGRSLPVWGVWIEI